MSTLERPIRPRHATHGTRVGSVIVGGKAPIVVQATSSTDTADVAATVQKIKSLADAGAELVRISIGTSAAARAVPVIRDRLAALGCAVPLIGDFHFDGRDGGHTLLAESPACAEALGKYRIDPVKFGARGKYDSPFAIMIEHALRWDKPVRIGVNRCNLDRDLLARMMDENARLAAPLDAVHVMREALVCSATRSAQRAEELGLGANRIILSCKVAGVQELIAVYAELARRCDYPLHLGLPEAGAGSRGIVASTAAMAVLLQQGIGDTIRVALEPDGDRPREILVAQEILQTMGLRSFAPQVTACPGCGRTTSTVFQELAEGIQAYLREQMPTWRARYAGVETMTVAIMGCVVNGPGESKMANIGISLPGTGEVPVAPVYVDGQKTVTLKGERIAEEFQLIVADYVRATYGGDEATAQLKPATKTIAIKAVA